MTVTRHHLEERLSPHNQISFGYYFSRMTKLYTTQLTMHYVLNIGKDVEGRGRDLI
jgi:hypothetical protein